MGGPKAGGETATKSHPKYSEPFAHLKPSPFPIELLPSDIHVPQNRFLVLIKHMRERVMPGVDYARSLPSTIELAIKDVKHGDGKEREEESDKDR